MFKNFWNALEIEKNIQWDSNYFRERMFTNRVSLRKFFEAAALSQVQVTEKRKGMHVTVDLIEVQKQKTLDWATSFRARLHNVTRKIHEKYFLRKQKAKTLNKTIGMIAQ